MFVDRVKIHVKGGDGGDGKVSFYRAKYITHGGPDGGDGGKGGNVVFVGESGMSTLMDFRYKRKFVATPGEPGGKRNCFGKDGEDIIIKVPVGTVIREAESGKVMADITTAGEEKILIHGGKGGKGNQHFATPTRQAPRYAEPGRKSKEYDVILELKLIADVGLIGFPNVGKSTLLSMVTNANPKIAGIGSGFRVGATTAPSCSRMESMLISLVFITRRSASHACGVERISCACTSR